MVVVVVVVDDVVSVYWVLSNSILTWRVHVGIGSSTDGYGVGLVSFIARQDALDPLVTSACLPASMQARKGKNYFTFYSAPSR